jgi:hypothetical protein
MSEARRMIAAADEARTTRRELKRRLVSLYPQRTEEIIREILHGADIFQPAVEHKALAAMERAFRDAEKSERHYGRAYDQFWNSRAAVISGSLTGKIATLFVEGAARRMEQTRIDIANWDMGNLQEIHDLYLDLLADGMLAGKPLEEVLRGLKCVDAFGALTGDVTEAVSTGDGVVVRNEDGDMLQVSDFRLRICRLRNIEGSNSDIAALNSYVIGEQRRILDELLVGIEALVNDNGGSSMWHEHEIEAIEAFSPTWYLRRTNLATRLANELFLRLGKRSGQLADDFTFKLGEEPYKEPDTTLVDESFQ